jgi:hypothetical protein
MVCSIRTNNGFHYLRISGNLPTVYCGNNSFVTPTPTPTPTPIPINQNFFITLIDEADPAYSYENGSIVGALWETDVNTFNNLSMNNDAVIVFDVGNRTTQLGQTVIPNNGIGSNSPVSNIVDTTRPTVGDSISQNALFAFLQSSIENIWGSDFWTRFASSGYNLIIILDISGSLTRNVIGEGLDAFESFLTSEGVTYTEFNACSNERWLNWIAQAYNDPNIDPIEICSCVSGLYCEPDLRWIGNENRCLIDSSYYDSTKVTPYQTSIVKPIHRWAGDTTNYGSLNLNPNIDDNVFVSNKIKITVNDPVFGGTYVFDRGIFNSNDPDHQVSDISNWSLNITESTINIPKYQDTTTSGTAFDYHNRYGIEFYDVSQVQGAAPWTLGEYQTAKYPGYLETKIKSSGFYDGIDYIQYLQLEDAFAFPCHFVFTAIVPPDDTEGAATNDAARLLDLYGSNSTTEVMPTGIGHRFVAGFSMPLRYRYESSDWHLVNSAIHAVSGIAPNYYIEADRDTYYTAPAAQPYPDGRLFNSILMWIAGMPTTQTDNPDVINYTYGYNFYLDQYENAVGTIQYPGFAFRASGVGIPYQGSYNNLTDVLGPQQEYAQISDWSAPSYDNNREVPWYDYRPLFTSKVASNASIEFVDGCEYVKCQQLGSPQTISTTSYTSNFNCYNENLNGCTVLSSFLCTTSGIPYPTLSDFNNLGVTSYNVVYSGILTDSIGIYAGLKNNDEINIDILVPSQESNQIVNINYNGANNPTAVLNYIQSNINMLQINLSNNEVDQTRIKYADVIWTVNSTLATAKVIPNLKTMPYQIEIINAGTSGANGIYTYDKQNSMYINDINNDWHISFVSTANDSGVWNISYDDNINSCPQSYYSLSGISGTMPINTEFTLYQQTNGSSYSTTPTSGNWSNDGLAGLSGVPNSKIYLDIYGGITLPIVTDVNDYPIVRP